MPPTISTIRILEAEPNKRGDLFGRLMGDLFLALGYDQIRLNIHKSGRELDIDGQHRTERRRVIAECKALESKIGGDEVNKFVGALDVEKRKNSKIQTAGYFISLSGFTETAIEQEEEAGDDRVIRLNGNRIIEELIKGRIIVSQAKAMERAGRCAAGQPLDLLPEAECELLAHEIGWIWVVYFTKNKRRTHFALIHADGESIAASLAQTITQSDKFIGGSLHSLIYLPPLEESSISENQILQAKSKYFEYLKSECGEITLEGLPADQEVGSRRLNLENIFVPLYLEPSTEYVRDPSLSSEEDEPKADRKERLPIGKVLSESSRLAILATPGGGKTTLLKRIAVAYAFPDRRKLIDDNLPDR